MKNYKDIVLRFIVYMVFLVVLGGLLNYIAGFGDMRQFKEGGAVEWLQFATLGIAAVLLLRAAVLDPPDAKIFPLIAAFLAMIAMVRECDTLLKQNMPVGGWKLPVAVIAVAAILVAWYNRKALGRELETLLLHPVFSLMWCGLAVVIFGQMIGHGDFLEPLLGEDYARDYKRLLEECIEILGYYLILIGSIEFFYSGARTSTRRG